MNRRLSAKIANRFAPRVVVLLLDLVVTVFAFVCAWTLHFNFQIDAANWHWNHLLTLFLFRLLVFLWTRPFAGIIRHTGVEDATLVSQAVTFSSLLAGVGSYSLTVLYSNSELQIPGAVLGIEYFISLVMLISIRFAVKYLYQWLVNRPVGKVRTVLIYGAGAMGIYTKELLQRDGSCHILGFIDDNPAKVQKSIRGLRVFSPLEAAALFLQANQKPVVILAIDRLSAYRRNEIATFLLHYQVLVKMGPLVQDWINGQLNTRQIRNVRIEDLLGRPIIRVDNAVIGRLVQNCRVLVTGAAGSIGGELVRQLLLHHPGEIILLDQAESALYNLVFTLRHESGDTLTGIKLTTQIADVTDRVRMKQLFAYHRPQFVFHTAAYKHVPLMEQHPYEAVNVNILGTQVVADMAVAFGVDKFVMISTDKAVKPTSVMGATKRLAELYVHSLNGTAATVFVTTRFGNVLDSSGSVVPIFKQQIEAGGPVTVTHPDVIRYFMTIPEACQLVLEAAAMGSRGDVFVFDMGQPVRIADLARQMIRLSGYEVDKDIALHFTGLRPGEKLFEELLNDNESVLPTHHPKIKVVRQHPPDPARLKQAVEQLTITLRTGDSEALVAVLKQLIPEYVSSNSPYATLDQPPFTPTPN